MTNTDFDLAVSFSGKDRDYVLAVVNEIKKYIPEENIFYDCDYSEELAGKDLFEYLREVYAEKSRYVMCFFSSEYNRSNWARVEASAVKDRLFLNFMNSSFLIPVIIDRSSNFLPATIGFWEKDKFTVEEIAKMTVHKIKTGESVNLNFSAILDLEDLAYSLKDKIADHLSMYHKEYDCTITDEGFHFAVKNVDCTYNFGVDYKVLGLRALLLRYETENCSLGKTPHQKQLTPFSCNAFITNSNGMFSVHDFNFFDTDYSNISGNDAIKIIIKKIADKLNEGCKCLF